MSFRKRGGRAACGLWVGITGGAQAELQVINRRTIMEIKQDRTAWLKGGTAVCERPAKRQKRPRRLVLLGAPGVGKGTQAELLSAKLGTCPLSTGDIFRTAKGLEAGELTPAMRAALGCMRRGELVPDETVLALIAERTRCLRCQAGFMLDGFPRTVNQAEALERLLSEQRMKLDAVLSYELPLDQVVARLSGRRTCLDCKAVFHVSARPPMFEGICDACGGKLYQREDDRPESIRVRMKVYEQCTTPLTDYYRRRGLLASILAEGSPEEIFNRTLDTLRPRQAALQSTRI
jgi:adenylate kinase